MATAHAFITVPDVPGVTDNEDRRLSRGMTIAAWVLAALLAFFFLAAGAPKLMGQQMHLDNFERWGYPVWFMYVIGALETVAALLLLYPRTAPYAAGALGVDMVGATATHLRFAEWTMVPFTLALFALVFALGWIRQPLWFRTLRTRKPTAPAPT